MTRSTINRKDFLQFSYLRMRTLLQRQSVVFVCFLIQMTYFVSYNCLARYKKVHARYIHLVLQDTTFDQHTCRKFTMEIFRKKFYCSKTFQMFMQYIFFHILPQNTKSNAFLLQPKIKQLFCSKNRECIFVAIYSFQG